VGGGGKCKSTFSVAHMPSLLFLAGAYHTSLFPWLGFEQHLSVQLAMTLVGVRTKVWARVHLLLRAWGVAWRKQKDLRICFQYTYRHGKTEQHQCLAYLPLSP